MLPLSQTKYERVGSTGDMPGNTHIKCEGGPLRSFCKQKASIYAGAPVSSYVNMYARIKTWSCFAHKCLRQKSGREVL